MSFRDNLIHLRATRNMTQEQLAVMVGVSRQSVTKWESGRSYPEMDKLLTLCQLFDCTLDELVQGDLTTRESEPALAVPTTALAEDVIGYDEHWRAFAKHISLGVVACIAAVGASSVVDGMMGDGPTAVAFFGFVLLGLAFIIPAGIGHAAFQKAHPYVANFYTDEERTAQKRRLGISLVAGIGIILLGFVISAFGDTFGDGAQIGAGFFLCGATGVGIIVYAGMMDSRLDIESYNISALEEVDEEEIASIVGAARATAVLDKVRRNKRTGLVCGIIMLVATAIALPLMFWATQCGDPFWSKFFWIPWMVGGLMCGIASTVFSAS